MKPRDYCCCAIPLVNAGIYTTLTEQLALFITVGTLSVATPHIVGAATPVAAPIVLAIICYVGAGIQIMGYFGVAMEKPILFRRYVTLHSLVAIAAFSVSAVWIILSATSHTAARTRCERDFFPSTGDTSSEGKILCDIFPWVDIGLMGGLWLLLAILQLYLWIILSSYSTSQQDAHAEYTDIPLQSKLAGDLRFSGDLSDSDEKPNPGMTYNSSAPTYDPYAPTYPGGYTSQAYAGNYAAGTDDYYAAQTQPGNSYTGPSQPGGYTGQAPSAGRAQRSTSYYEVGK
jgi:hypothetical protein